MWDVDLSDTDLDLLDKDIPSKHFVCLQDVFKTCLPDVFKICLQDIFSATIFRLPRRLQDVFARRLQDMSWRPTNVCWAIISISCIWVEYSIWGFLSAAFIENLKSYRSGTTTSTSHSRKLERSYAEILSATLKNLSNLL